MATESMAYVSFGKCGCVFSLMVDSPAVAKEIAKEIRATVKEGGRMERISVEAARALPISFKGCPTCKPKLWPAAEQAVLA